jgi:hypothetical protein
MLLVRIVSRAVLYWELFGPFLWISPWKHHWCRMLGCMGMTALHLGFIMGIQIQVPDAACNRTEQHYYFENSPRAVCRSIDQSRSALRIWE